MGGAVLLRVICMAIYMAFGIDPMESTQFGGDPTNYMGNASWKIFFKLLITGPLHFQAFSGLDWHTSPFALTTVLVPMAGGCAIAYARVNLGFW